MSRHLFLQFFLPEENRFYDAISVLNEELSRHDIELVLFTESKSDHVRGIRNIHHDHSLTAERLESMPPDETMEGTRDLAALKTQACLKLSASPEAAEKSRAFWYHWIDELSPIGVLVAEQNIPSSQVLVECCRDSRIPYWHFSKGVFDDTIQIDPCGHLRDGSMIMSPTLASAELDNQSFKHSFGEIAEFFLNQNHSHYPDINSGTLPEDLQTASEAPVILLLGAGNITTLSWPDQAGRISPLFHHSREMVDWFVDHRNDLPSDCRVAYKNHPWDQTDYSYLSNHGIDWLPQVDVRSLVARADVVVSISTIVQFECILLRKPQVVLGNSELSGKGIAYEAGSADEIMAAVESSLEQKDFAAMQKHAEAFVERICNLFLIGINEGMPCAFTLNSIARYFSQFKNLVRSSGRIDTETGAAVANDRAGEGLEMKRLEIAARKYEALEGKKEKLEAKVKRLQESLEQSREKLAHQKSRLEQWNQKSFLHRAFHKLRW